MRLEKAYGGAGQCKHVLSHLYSLGRGKHLLQTFEGLVCEVERSVPRVLLWEVFDALKLASDLLSRSVLRHAVHGRHDRLLDHLVIIKDDAYSEWNI